MEVKIGEPKPDYQGIWKSYEESHAATFHGYGLGIVDWKCENIEQEIKEGRFIGPEYNKAHPNQHIIIVSLNSYPCVVPFVIEDYGVWFLKTIYQSRKFKGKM